MERMKAVVGCARHSDMGQVQLTTMFCSMRVVRYSRQQSCEGRRGEISAKQDLHHLVHVTLETHPPSTGCTKPPQTMDKCSKVPQKWEWTNQELKDHKRQGS